MPLKAPMRLLLLTSEDEQRSAPLRGYLEGISLINLESASNGHLPTSLGEYNVIVLMDARSLSTADEEQLIGFVHQGGGCLAFAGSSSDQLSPLFGARVGPLGPQTQMRVSFADPQDPIARRFPSEIYLHDRFQPLEAVNRDTRSILNTTWQHQCIPLALCREEGAGRVCVTTLKAFQEPLFQRMVYRLVRLVAGQQEQSSISAAVVGYGPPGSVGYVHSLSLHQVPGFKLDAICDISRERRERAQTDFVSLHTYASVHDLARAAEIELVVVATPPDSHAKLAIQLLEAGKHVVVEKPMCLTEKEAAAMIQAAEVQDRVLSVYQNRRWDADYLAIKEAVDEGLIGEPFYLETFVGAYSHPCRYWHSERQISGGTIYDWGAHYVDWILNLFSAPTELVIGTIQKRVWHDVTNADHARTQIRFAGGQEAEFIHSDIAALRKPKWYLLGTEGAIIGEWNEMAVQEVDPVFYFKEHQIPITETVPRLTLRRRHVSGSLVTQELPLPRTVKYAYYQNLADHLLTGEPLAVTAHSASRVVAVLEATMRSSKNGGKPEVLRV